MKRAVVGIIKNPNNSSFAFLQREDETWTFPGGKPEEGEDLDAALVREVKEETGLTVIAAYNLGSRMVGNTRVFYKVCQYLGGDLELKEPEKFVSAGWVSPEVILKTAGGHLFAPVQDYLFNYTSRTFALEPQ